MSVSIAVVVESKADLRTIVILCDRLIIDRVVWIDDQIIDFFRTYRGVTSTVPFILWRNVRRIADEAGIVVIGFMNGLPAGPDAHAARRILLTLDRVTSRPDIVFLVRDLDDQPERLPGLLQARESVPNGHLIVIGAAQTMRECWVLAAFEERDDSENKNLAELRQELGFCPKAQSHRLTAKHDSDLKSPKRVLGKLTGKSVEREEEALIQVHLDDLRSRGNENGLADFLTEIEERLLPRFAHVIPQ